MPQSIKKRDKEDTPDRHDKKIGISKRDRFSLTYFLTIPNGLFDLESYPDKHVSESHRDTFQV